MMKKLPDLKECFAAHIILARLFVGLDTLRSGKDEGAMPVAHMDDLARTLVYATTRFRDTLYPLDEMRPICRVFEGNVERLLDFLTLLLDRGDISCIFKLFGDRVFE